MFLFSGVFFPISQLPAFAQTIAWFSPLTHMVSPSRAFIGGNFDPTMLWDFLWLLALGAIAYLAALVLMRRRLIK